MLFIEGFPGRQILSNKRQSKVEEQASKLRFEVFVQFWIDAYSKESAEEYDKSMAQSVNSEPVQDTPEMIKRRAKLKDDRAILDALDLTQEQRLPSSIVMINFFGGGK